VRKIYINTIWQAYPELKESVQTYSFVMSQISSDNSLCVSGKIQILDNDNIKLWHGENSFLCKIPSQLKISKGELFWKDILANNDLILIRGKWHNQNFIANHVQLLAISKAVAPKVAISIAEAIRWQEFLALIRLYFKKQNFIEVQTPTLVNSPGGEPFLDVFSTEFQYGSKKREVYLPTSPELHHKKLLANGWPQIFEIKTCFRNNEIGPLHQAEFQMLEWYRPYKKLADIIIDLKALLQLLEQKKLCEHVGEWKTISMAQLFFDALQFKLLPTTTTQELEQLCQAHAIHYTKKESWEDLFFRLFVDKIEPNFKLQPLIIFNFPPQLAAMARINSRGWAERMEFYWRRIEIANAYDELNDPGEQYRRLSKENEIKLQLGKKVPPIDEEFLQALEHGMPPTSGIALGLERLYMATYNENDIKKTRPFPMNCS